jgi:basic amino acid/polyamine antiporter, APA family
MTTTASTADPARPSAEPQLKRVLGPGLLLLFIVGDILGTGIYALTGTVAGEVGGAVWIPFGCAFLVALLTACSYLELVTKYPQAAGAALYTHKAFGIHFVTFMVAFTVLSSGITSASTAARAFATNLAKGFGLTFEDGVGLTLAALAFLLLVALINFRGVGESVKTNVVLTCIELSGLLFILLIGAIALGSGDGDWSAVTKFDVADDSSAFTAVGSATALAFFALVGFEDSVNMAEETRNPARIFPKMMFAGLAITGTIYILVGIVAVALVPLDQLSEGSTPLLQVVEAGASWFPLWIFAFVTMFAVSNTALINMLMASRLVYGLSNERVVPKVLGRVHSGRRTPWVAIVFTTLLGFGLVTFVTEVPDLSGTTALLLLAVFTVVNVAVLVLRRDKVDHPHFTAPTFIPVLGALVCLYLVSPLIDRDVAQYKTAGVLLGIGVLLWVVTAVHRHSRDENRGTIDDPSHLS